LSYSKLFFIKAIIIETAQGIVLDINDMYNYEMFTRLVQSKMLSFSKVFNAETMLSVFSIKILLLFRFYKRQVTIN